MTSNVCNQCQFLEFEKSQAELTAVDQERREACYRLLSARAIHNIGLHKTVSATI
jgi:hypothetical protein